MSTRPHEDYCDCQGDFSKCCDNEANYFEAGTTDGSEWWLRKGFCITTGGTLFETEGLVNFFEAVKDTIKKHKKKIKNLKTKLKPKNNPVLDKLYEYKFESSTGGADYELCMELIEWIENGYKDE